MTFCNTHRLVPCKVIIREASSGNKLALTQRPRTGQYTESNCVWNTQPYMGCLHQVPLFSGLRAQRAKWKSWQKDFKSQRRWITPKKRSLLSIKKMINENTSSQRMW